MFLVISTVQNTNVFSLIMACVSIPFLIWSLFVNVFAELFDRFTAKFGKRHFDPQPVVNDEGETTDARTVISNIDGVQNVLRQMHKKR